MLNPFYAFLFLFCRNGFIEGAGLKQGGNCSVFDIEIQTPLPGILTI